MAQQSHEDEADSNPNGERCAGFMFRGSRYHVLSRQLPPHRLLADLTDAELSVCMLARRGLSNREIASVRNSDPRTVDSQLASAFGKLGVHSRLELARVMAESLRPPERGALEP